MKTIILGMNNPYSLDPYYALYPYPENSAGARLCGMFLEACERNKDRAVRANYIKGFERMNLVNQPTYSTADASARADSLKKQLRGRRVIICGVSVLTALKLVRHEWLVWRERSGDLFLDSFDYVLIPHPSGRCREYNDPEMGRAVGDLLYKEWKLNEAP